MKKANKKVNASIIIIGNEILSGRTQDVNVVAISNWLNELGVKVEEVRIISDIEDSIVKTINDMNRHESEWLFATIQMDQLFFFNDEKGRGGGFFKNLF